MGGFFPLFPPKYAFAIFQVDQLDNWIAWKSDPSNQLFWKYLWCSRETLFDSSISIIHNRNFDRKANIDHFKGISNDNCSYFIQSLKSRISKPEESFSLIQKIYTRSAESDDLDKIALHYANLFRMIAIILTKALVSEFYVFRKLSEIEFIEKKLSYDIKLLS